MRRALLVAGGGSSFTLPPEPPDFGQALPGSFTKSGSSPIISNGAAGTWRSGWVDGVAIFRDTRINRYVVTVGGWDGSKYQTGIFYIDSLADVYAGTETPEEEATNPVFSPVGGISNIVAWTTMQMPDGTYRAYWQNYTGTDTIHLCTSSDRTTWTHQNGGSPVLSPTGAATFDQTAVFDPFPRLRADGKTELWYAGKNAADARAIGMALLDTDGITVLSRGQEFTPDFGNGDVSGGFGAVAPIGSSETSFGVFCDHRYAVYGTGRSIDYRYTTDGSTYTRVWDVLTPDNVGWDAIQVFDSAPMWADGVLYLLHCGGDLSGDATGINAKVGIAKVDWPA
jgi:hypothetical protein